MVPSEFTVLTISCWYLQKCGSFDSLPVLQVRCQVNVAALFHSIGQMLIFHIFSCRHRIRTGEKFYCCEKASNVRVGVNRSFWSHAITDSFRRIKRTDVFQLFHLISISVSVMHWQWEIHEESLRSRVKPTHTFISSHKYLWWSDTGKWTLSSTVNNSSELSSEADLLSFHPAVSSFLLTL